MPPQLHQLSSQANEIKRALVILQHEQNIKDLAYQPPKNRTFSPMEKHSMPIVLPIIGFLILALLFIQTFAAIGYDDGDFAVPLIAGCILLVVSAVYLILRIKNAAESKSYLKQLWERQQQANPTTKPLQAQETFQDDTYGATQSEYTDRKSVV